MKQKNKTIAKLYIDGSPKMTHEGRQEVAEWIANQAKSLVENGAGYSSVFVARYIVKRPQRQPRAVEVG